VQTSWKDRAAAAPSGGPRPGRRSGPVATAQTDVRLQEARLRLQAAREQEETTAHTYRALAERARQQLASCPRCREPVRGDDLLVSGHCPNPTCRMALSSLLLPAPRAGFDPNEYLALLGALDVLVGMALATTAEPTG